MPTESGYMMVLMGITSLGNGNIAAAKSGATHDSLGKAAGMANVERVGSSLSSPAKRATPSEKEILNLTSVKTVNGESVLMTPSVIGKAYSTRKPYSVIHCQQLGLMGAKVYREAAQDAQLLVHSNEMLPKYMMYVEGGTYEKPAPQRKTAAHIRPQSVEQSTESQIEYADAEVQVPTQLTGRYDMTLVVPGFGDISFVCSSYEITGNELILMYDNVEILTIPSPKPPQGKDIAVFVMEIMDKGEKHVFELAAPFTKSPVFEYAPGMSVTIQHLCILRHQSEKSEVA